MSSTGDPELEPHLDKLRFLATELDRQRTSHAARTASSNSRSAFLAGSAAIAGTIQAVTVTDGWQIASAALAVIATVLGVIAGWPRFGPDVNVRHFHSTLYLRTLTELERDVFATRLKSHDDDETKLRRTARILRVGYLALGAAIVLGAVSKTLTLIG